MTKITDIFFVLKGLLNGESGVYAVRAGGDITPTTPRLADGWYFFDHSSGTEEHGPFESRDETVKKLEHHGRVRVSGLVILGHEFRPLTRDEGQEYAGAELDTMICRCPHADLLWDPRTMVLTEHLASKDLALSEEGEEVRSWTFEVLL